MKTCPVCELEISESIPSFCPQCGWDLKNDPTLVPSLDNIPDEFLEDYRQRVEIARRNWKQNQNLVARLEKLEDQIGLLQKLFKINDKALIVKDVLDEDDEYFVNKRRELLEDNSNKINWDMIKEKYPIGSTIEGTIRAIIGSGISVLIDKDIDGFIDKFDISRTEEIKYPFEYKIGQRVQAVVLEINEGNELISLGIKQLDFTNKPNIMDEDEDVEAEKYYNMGLRCIARNDTYNTVQYMKRAYRLGYIKAQKYVRDLEPKLEAERLYQFGLSYVNHISLAEPKMRAAAELGHEKAKIWMVRHGFIMP